MGGALGERRGSETFDHNNDIVLIHAPMDDVGRALADRAERWELQSNLAQRRAII